MNAVPLELHLPDGAATLVPGSFEAGQPRYERDGHPLDVDVTIPPELEAAGWIWHGSFLRKPGTVGIAICTRTFPPPQCFDNARALERIRADLDAAARPEPARPKPQRAVPEPTTVSEQLAMELV